MAGLYENLNAGDPTKWNFEPDLSKQGMFYIHAAERQHPPHLAGDAEAQGQLLLREPGPGLVQLRRPASRRRRCPTSVFDTNDLISGQLAAPLTNRLLLDVRMASHAEVYHQIIPPDGERLPEPDPGHRAGRQYSRPHLPRAGHRWPDEHLLDDRQPEPVQQRRVTVRT